jgi:glycolate oxidase
MTYSRVTEKDVAALTDIVTAERVIYPATVHYDHDQFKQVRSLPDMAVQPQTNEEVAAILRYANEHLIPVTVRGNATGLMGANVPIEHGIDIDMIKMNKVLDYDPDDLTLTVQNGFRIRDINEFLADKPFTYIPAPAMKWATIGGNASTNAGGMRAVKYGTNQLLMVPPVHPLTQNQKTKSMKLLAPRSMMNQRLKKNRRHNHQLMKRLVPRSTIKLSK